jgi:thermostable 8-oxoguanine DNA glycosylase
MTCNAEELEKIYGIGMKTSRCFLIHSRKNARYAGLDTHVLKFLRAKGVQDVPKSTPTSRKLYLRLEAEFLKLSDESGKSVADLDLEVWNKYKV